jgi:3-oxoacyl-[acyl-carrier protein] reductase
MMPSTIQVEQTTRCEQEHSMTDSSDYYPPRLQGQVAVVTGAARGLGRAYALRLAKLGADIVVNDIKLDAAADVQEELTADTVMDEIRQLGRRAIGIEADVTSETAVHEMFQIIFEAFGQIDILVNNAGGGRGSKPVTSCSIEDWEAVMAKNLRATFLCCRAVSTHMRERQRGKIINVASVAALRPLMPTLAPYCTAKAGIVALTRSLALELAEHGVNVNAIAPGYVATVNWMGGLGKIQDELRPQIPMGRIGQTEDCAKVVEFLATDLSDFVTGQVISVDGGMGHLQPAYLGPAY